MWSYVNRDGFCCLVRSWYYVRLRLVLEYHIASSHHLLSWLNTYHLTLLINNHRLLLINQEVNWLSHLLLLNFRHCLLDENWLCWSNLGVDDSILDEAFFYLVSWNDITAKSNKRSVYSDLIDYNWTLSNWSELSRPFINNELVYINSAFCELWRLVRLVVILVNDLWNDWIILLRDCVWRHLNVVMDKILLWGDLAETWCSSYLSFIGLIENHSLRVRLLNNLLSNDWLLSFEGSVIILVELGIVWSVEYSLSCWGIGLISETWQLLSASPWLIISIYLSDIRIFAFPCLGQCEYSANSVDACQSVWNHVSKILFYIGSKKLNSLFKSDFSWGPWFAINVVERTGFSLETQVINIILDRFKNQSDHSMLMNSCFNIREVFFNMVVHPYFTHAFTVDADVLLWYWETVLDDAARQYMETLQALGIYVQCIGEGNVCYCL